ncbi:MAG: lipoprotein [Syntrophaceae bacterium]|nr:lipoprotein [Syntrophaceae bacterium]
MVKKGILFIKIIVILVAVALVSGCSLSLVVKDPILSSIN